MDRNELVHRLTALGVPFIEEDLAKLLSQWQAQVDALSAFPSLNPMGDEPVLIYHPEVADDKR